MCRTCDDGPRYSRFWLFFGLAMPLHLPKGAYVDHLALICSGPLHHLCFRGKLRGTWWRITLWQLWHALSMTHTGRLFAAAYSGAFGYSLARFCWVSARSVLAL